MTRTGQRFVPDPAQTARYDALYGRVYSRLYRQLQPLYQAIRRIR